MVSNPFPADSETSEPLIIQHFSLRIVAGVSVILFATVTLVVLNVLALVLIGGNLVLQAVEENAPRRDLGVESDTLLCKLLRQ